MPLRAGPGPGPKARPTQLHLEAAHEHALEEWATKVIRHRRRTVDLDGFLSHPLFAHMATASDRGPRSSPVWFLWEDGALWIIGNRTTDTFPQRIMNDPRCAISIVDFDRARGLVHHVGLRGRASVEPFEEARARRILARYLGPKEEGWDRRFIDSLDDPDNVLVRFEPETAVARDQSYSPAV